MQFWNSFMGINYIWFFFLHLSSWTITPFFVDPGLQTLRKLTRHVPFLLEPICMFAMFSFCETNVKWFSDML